MNRTMVITMACSVCIWFVANLNHTATAVPISFAYSGELLTASGAVADGTFKFEATLHSQAQNGDLLWGPADFGDVQVNDGDFVLVFSELMSAGHLRCASSGGSRLVGV